MQRPRTVSAHCTLAIALVFTLASGCQKDPQKKKTTEKQSPSQTAAGVDDLLDHAVDMLQPDRLTISSDRVSAAAVLNDWFKAVQKQTEPDLSVPAGLTERIDDRARERLKLVGFGARDCDHLRTSFLLKGVAIREQGDSPDDLARIVHLFHFVMRTIVLTDEPAQFGMTPFHACLFGEGTATDRAWVFASALRQLRVDSVLLTPAGKSEPALLGVSLKNEVYLFDPLYGIPVPNPAKPGAPATLAQFKAQGPDVFKALALPDQPHPWMAEKAEGLSYLAVSNSDLWSPRMNVLQQALTGDDSLVVYDSLLDADGEPGLLSRLQSAVGEADAAIGVWNYPEQQLASFSDPTDEALDAFRKQMEVMNAPRDDESEDKPTEQQTPTSITQGTRGLLKARIADLTGDWDNAMGGYQKIRFLLSRSRLSKLSGSDFVIQSRAASRALFWGGVLQISEGENAAAINTMRQFAKQRPGGPWEADAHLKIVQSALADSDTEQAVGELESMNPQSRQHQTAQLQIQRAGKTKRNVD